MIVIFAGWTKSRIARATVGREEGLHPDYDFLLSESGQHAIVNLHVDGIIRYLSSVTSYNS